MNVRERFRAAMEFRAVDELPALEWICWWDKTIERWRGEGLPEGLGREDILRWFKMDVYERMWVSPRFKMSRIAGRSRDQGVMETEADYERLVVPALAQPTVNVETLRRMAEAQSKGEAVVGLQLDGFFWFPREIFGVEQHLYAFYDHPELMHRMNDDLCRFNMAVLEQVLEIVTPDVLTLAEDLSYNHGPMLSQGQFEEFVTPYYQRLVPLAKRHGIIPMVDTDGDVTTVVPWMEAAGIEGCSPLERMAGVDVAELRRRHPKWLMVGGFDKTLMHLGEGAMRAEFERLLPVMRSGGFVATVDHQTPPDVSLEGYRLYVRLLREYCRKAGRG